jgi:hypothetical protein
MNKKLEDQDTERKVDERIKARFTRMSLRLDEGSSTNKKEYMEPVILSPIQELCGP